MTIDTLLFSNVTGVILDCYYRVYHPISSPGLDKESVKRAMIIELQKRGIGIRQNVTVTHRYDNRKIGSDRLDLVVDGKVALDIRHQTTIRDRDKARLRTCLLDGGFAVGLVLNFGAYKPQTARVYESSHAPKTGGPA
jgi:GxxExxY protein